MLVRGCAATASISKLASVVQSNGAAMQIYQAENTRLSGQVNDLKSQAIKLESDKNELARSKDVEVQKITDEKNKAETKLSYWESLPSTFSIYTNLASAQSQKFDILSNQLETIQKNTANVERFAVAPNGQIRSGITLKGNPSNSVAEIKLAIKSFSEFDYTNAFTHASQAIEMENASLSGISLQQGGLTAMGKHAMYFIGGVSAQFFQENALALKWLKNAATANPKDFKTQAAYLTCLMSAGQTNEAGIALKRAFSGSTNRSDLVKLGETLAIPLPEKNDL
jgi:hypothetical protein